MKNWVEPTEAARPPEREEQLRVLAAVGYRLALTDARLHPTLGWRTRDEAKPLRGRWRDSRNPMRMPR
jgi:hypothetical protein